MRTSFITSNFSSLLKKCTQTLKSVNFGYLSFKFFFNFNYLLEFSVKFYQNFQNTLFFMGKKKNKNY
jgi:hypothetical protein